LSLPSEKKWQAERPPYNGRATTGAIRCCRASASLAVQRTLINAQQSPVRLGPTNAQCQELDVERWALKVERLPLQMKKKLTRPFVMATFAMTIDGKITTRTFSLVDFTSRADKQHLLRQRSLGDAVLVGHTTLRRDNVRLGIANAELRNERIKRGQSAYPLRVIVSNEGKIDARLNIFQSNVSPIVIFSTTRMPREYRCALMEKATLHLSGLRQVDLAEMLHRLKNEYKVRTVACEGGAVLFRALLEQDLVDQLNLTIAPYVFGSATAPTITGLSKDFLPRSVHCILKDMRVVGDECFLTYRIKHRK
jgi:5-amino-6-(5-phosphoribosylamino)uracil reductase